MRSLSYLLTACLLGTFCVSCAQVPRVMEPSQIGTYASPPVTSDGISTYFCKTDDGWNLALHRFGGAQPSAYQTPVILCHDLAQNSSFWDLHRKNGFARILSEQGFDVWTVDLRGAGQSTKVGWLSRKQFKEGPTEGVSRFGKEDWTTDDIIHLDIPAILRFVQQQTHHNQVSWIGQGMGASIMVGFLVTHDRSMVKNFVALGMPMMFPKPLLNDILIDLAKQKEPKQLAAAFNGRWYAGDPSASAAGLRAPLDELYYYLPNMEGAALDEMQRNATEDVPPGELEQFGLMIRSGEFLSSDRRTNYTKGLEKITVPTLLAVGRLDNFSGLVNAYEIYSRISSADKTLKIFSRANGSSLEYGHNDLIVGKKAPAEIYPPIAAWLKERS